MHFYRTYTRSITEKALSPVNVINLMSYISERQYEKGLSIHNTERYLPHMLVFLCSNYFCLT